MGVSSRPCRAMKASMIALAEMWMALMIYLVIGVMEWLA